MKFKFLDIVQLNGLLRDDQSVVRIKLSPDNEYAGIVLVSERYLDSYILNPSDELIDVVEAFFHAKNINITWNNTGSTFWVKGDYHDE